MGRPEGAFLIGEVGCGTLRRRRKILSLLRVLPQAPVAEPSEILEFIEKRRLMGRGIGLVDVHLLAAALLSRALLWTHDRRLGKVAGDLGISFSLHFSSRLVTNTRVTTLVSLHSCHAVEGPA